MDRAVEFATEHRPIERERLLGAAGKVEVGADACHGAVSVVNADSFRKSLAPPCAAADTDRPEGHHRA
jgi:hypothetical protein